MQVRIRFQPNSVRRYLRRMPEAVQKATARGLNKAVEQGKTQAKLQIKARRNLPVRGAILPSIHTRKIRTSKVGLGSRLTASIIVDGRSRSLRRYGAKVVGQRGRGKRTVSNSPVRVTVIPGQPKIIQGAFVRKRDGSVFKRVGTARYPVEFLFGPSTRSAFDDPEVMRHMERWATNKVPGLIEHELRRELKRLR